MFKGIEDEDEIEDDYDLTISRMRTSLSKPPRLFAKRTLHHDQFTNVLGGK